jgi:hypothetical protein
VIVTVVTDRLSGKSIDLVVAHIAAIYLERLGENSAGAYTITMSGGWTVRCDKANGEKVRKALETASSPPPQS